jgi:hypothetical protein
VEAVRQTVLSCLAFLIFAGGAFGTAVLVDRQRVSFSHVRELAYLPKGEYLKLAVLGFRQITADILWLKAIQNFGGRTQSKEGYRAAYHAVDVLTDLDPHFAYAYQVAGTILGVWAGLVEESVAILSKGMSRNPTVWQLPFYLGYDYYYELHDPTNAAEYFRIASTLPGAPSYLPKLAARMTTEAGNPDVALEFIQRLLLSTQDERLREGLTQRMREVLVERNLRILERAISNYQQLEGVYPRSLQDMATRGLVAGVPEDPLGGRYEYDAETGTVKSTSLQRRLRVHRK